jgi:hypothetical protein
MGVRVDRPGMRWWDYHTVGAEMKMRIASGGSKDGPILTRREYMCDASYLVALQGDPELIEQLADALRKPIWTLYLGRKCCIPSRPILNTAPAMYDSLLEALTTLPIHRRHDNEPKPESVECFLDWTSTHDGDIAPVDAQIWYDVPTSLDPPAHRPRFVIQQTLTVGGGGTLRLADQPLQSFVSSPPRPRADYKNTEYRNMREQRLNKDYHLCVFCKSYGTTAQHITYRHAGGDEKIDELRTLCRLCHDAVTMIEYGLGMVLDRINPEEEQWRERIIEKREEIVRFRSLETRRRKLSSVEVE